MKQMMTKNCKRKLCEMVLKISPEWYEKKKTKPENRSTV
jgi:hypothetical protein